MSNRYVNVNITRQTKAVSQAGFGTSLILSTEKAAAYKEYTDLSAVGTDFGTDSKTYKLAAAIFGQTPRPDKVAIYGVVYTDADTPDELSAQLVEMVKEYNDFFFLHCTDQGDGEIEALAAWIDTQEKFYFASTSNQTLADTLESANTVLLVHPNPETYPAAAWVGACSTLDVGSYTWTFKTLNGIVAANYDETEIAAIEAANASTYIEEGGVNITSKGITTSGEYIDIIQGQYYLKARITEAVFALLVRMPKVPFTDGGIAMIVAEVEKELKKAAQQGIIALDEDENAIYTIDAPSRAEVAANDRATRTLPDVNWTATIAGAVENVNINGTLQI